MTKAEKEEMEIQKLTGKIIPRQKGEHLARMHELAEWLAKGNGQVCDYRGAGVVDRSCSVSDGIRYQIFESFDYCGSLVIKKWGDTEWHEPTREYMYGSRERQG